MTVTLRPCMPKLELPSFLPDFIFSLNVKLVHQTLNKVTLVAVGNKLNYNFPAHSYFTRTSNIPLIKKPKAKTLNYGLNSIGFQSVHNWNELLLYFRQDLTTLSEYCLCKEISNYFKNW